MRLSPNDPHSFSMHSALAIAHFFAGRYDGGIVVGGNGRAGEARLLLRHAYVAAASHALAGRLEAGRESHGALASARSHICVCRTSGTCLPFRRPEDFAKMAEGLRLAGLPE